MADEEAHGLPSTLWERSDRGTFSARAILLLTESHYYCVSLHFSPSQYPYYRRHHSDAIKDDSLLRACLRLFFYFHSKNYIRRMRRCSWVPISMRNFNELLYLNVGVNLQHLFQRNLVKYLLAAQFQYP